MFEENIDKYLQKYGFGHIRLKAVLFDMDGILFDSMPMHARAWAEAARRFHFDLTEEEAYEHEGRTGKSTIDILAQRCWGRQATEAEEQQIYEEKSNIFNTLPKAKPMPGADSLLQQIKKEGFQIVLVTGSGQKSLLQKLNKSYAGIFKSDLMVTSFDVKQGKPSAEPYLMALKKAGIKPNEAVVIENAPLGVRAGVAARIFTIAVNTGPLPDKKLLDEGANLLLPSMQMLSKQWAQLRNELQ